MNSNNRYTQIALTYTRTIPLRFWSFAFMGFVVWLLCLRRLDYGEQMAILMLGGTLAAWSGAIVAGHVKEQLADARASLTPNFRAPHLIVAAAFFALGTVGVAAFTMWQIGHIPREIGWNPVNATSLGFVTIILFWSAALSWMGHHGSLKLIFTIMAIGIFCATPPGLAFNYDLMAGRLPLAAYAILALSTAALVALWWRLAVLHEEMPEYFRLEHLNTRLRVQMTGDRFFRRAAALQTGGTTDWMCRTHLLDRVTNVANASFFKRAQHWRLVAGVGRVTLLAPLLISATLIFAILTDSAARGRNDDDLLMHFPVMIALLVPIIIAGFNLPRRWYTLATESLVPATRQQFLREQGGAVAMEVAVAWAWTIAAGYLPALIFKAELLPSYRLLACVLITAAAQVWFFSVAVWLLRWRNSLYLMGFVFFVICLGTLALVAQQFQAGPGLDLTTGPSPLVALALVIAGLIVGADAYRRWLVTDLD